MSVKAALVLSALLASCSGETGTITVQVVTAPGSSLARDVERLDVQIGDNIYTATRSGDTLALAAEFPARSGAQIALAGFDNAGDLVAVGKSAPLPLSAITTEITVYLAAPLSIAEAPAVAVARAETGSAVGPAGVLIAGGVDSAGAVQSDARFYSANQHTFVELAAMPEGRTAPTVFASDAGTFYMLGGKSPTGSDTATFWSIEARRIPNVVYSQVTLDPAYARSGKSAIHVGRESFVVDGEPVLHTTGLVAEPFSSTLDGVRDAMLHGGPLAALTPAGVVTLEGSSAFLFKDDVQTELPAFLTAPRTAPAVAATARYLIVAGGADELGAPLPTALVFDAVSLEAVDSLPLVVPRIGATALPLPTDQILIFGGRDATGAPIATVELFTPPL